MVLPQHDFRSEDGAKGKDVFVAVQFEVFELDCSALPHAVDVKILVPDHNFNRFFC